MNHPTDIMPLWNWIALGLAVGGFFASLIVGFFWSRKRKPERFNSAEAHEEYERKGGGS